MSDYLPIAGRIDSVKNTQSIEALRFQEHIEIDNVGQFPAPATKAITNSASVLMAVGSSNATGRRTLFIRNDGEGVALVSGVSTGGGRRLLPGQSITFHMGKDETSTGVTYKDVSVYARAETIATEIYIEEV